MQQILLSLKVRFIIQFKQMQICTRILDFFKMHHQIIFHGDVFFLCHFLAIEFKIQHEIVVPDV